MRTLLDDAHAWFLEELAYAGDLEVVLVEGLESDVPADVPLGDQVITDPRPLEPSPDSRMLLVRFPRPVAWHVVDESLTEANDSEARDDDGFLQALSGSAYLAYVERQHGWHAGDAPRHWRLWTEDEVVDVVAREVPVVEPFERR